MGFAVGYSTTEQISPGLQKEINNANNELTKGRYWLSCEPPHFRDYDGDGILRGASKPNFTPHPDDVAAFRAENLPDGTLMNLIEVLCELSRRFDIEWEIDHDHSEGPVGFIRKGVCDDEVLVQCEAFTLMAKELFGKDVLKDLLGEEGLDLEDFDPEDP